MPEAASEAASDLELLARLDRLRRQRGAAVLAHYYQPGPVQDAADLVGDSLELARAAARLDARAIVLCGVRFMAETAALLCPDKTVLTPDAGAGCALADMAAAADLARWKEAHPGHLVVAYVNSSAGVKALADICCTSANAAGVVAGLPAGRPALLVPDRNLAAYARRRTGRDIAGWDGFCPCHERLSPDLLRAARAAWPGAPLLAHPECRPEAAALADEVLGTAGMLRFARQSAAREILVATEPGFLHQLRRQVPDKRFHAVSGDFGCPDMALATLPKVVQALESMEPRVEIEPALARRAEAPIRRMLETMPEGAP